MSLLSVKQSKDANTASTGWRICLEEFRDLEIYVLVAFTVLELGLVLMV